MLSPLKLNGKLAVFSPKFIEPEPDAEVEVHPSSVPAVEVSSYGRNPIGTEALALVGTCDPARAAEMADAYEYGGAFGARPGPGMV